MIVTPVVVVPDSSMKISFVSRLIHSNSYTGLGGDCVCLILIRFSICKLSIEPKAKRFMQESFHMRFMLVFMP